MKQKQVRIGFTVGTWDVLHKGHINVLKACRKHCTYLIVGIMNDYWCHVQKGHTRPGESLQLRMTKLRNTGLADKIVILDTLDMTPYLQMVDVWLQGDDQKNMRPFDWPALVRLPRTPNISSTDILKGKNNAESA